MTYFLAILKWILVFALLAGGAFFLAKGLGVPVPLVKYKGLETNNLPAGAALLATGVLVAIFWKIKARRTVTRISELPGIGKFTEMVEHEVQYFRDQR